jgi:hypothetical protein
MILSSGKFGNIPIKSGISYEFLADSTASEILGLGIVGNWSGGSVEIGETKIINPRIDKDNIKLYYIFRKLLPFNSRFENPISFVHANGVIINVLGNDKEGFTFGGNTVDANSQLPKAIVDIVIPVLEEFNIDKADQRYVSTVFSKNLSDEEKASEFEIYQKEMEKKSNIEKHTLNYSIGLQLNEMEYKGLWALNSFIREYCLKTNEEKINGFSIPEFKDGLGHLITKNLSENKPFLLSNYIHQFTNAKLDKATEIEISNSMLTAKEYSISSFIDYQLNQLNYSFATVSMYQEFESYWKNAIPRDYNPANPNQEDKFKFIEFYIAESETKDKLAEMINARNNIIHTGKIVTFHKPNNPRKNVLKWNAENLNEYEIYAKKKPFEWNTALKRLKNSIQHGV